MMPVWLKACGKRSAGRVVAELGVIDPIRCAPSEQNEIKHQAEKESPCCSVVPTEELSLLQLISYAKPTNYRIQRFIEGTGFRVVS